jgi:Glyoxalase-like domain
MHLDLEADDVEAEVARLEALGATRRDHQAERGLTSGSCATPGATNSASCSRSFPELLARHEPWNPGTPAG